MGITEQGIKAERKALKVLKNCDYKCYQPDWIAFRNDEYIVVEVKGKERFEPPPFEGTGLDIYQVNARLAFQYKTGIRIMLLVEDSQDGWIWNWLDELEAGEYHDTKNGIRIYPIENYQPLLIEEFGK